MTSASSGPSANGAIEYARVGRREPIAPGFSGGGNEFGTVETHDGRTCPGLGASSVFAARG